MRKTTQFVVAMVAFLLVVAACSDAGTDTTTTTAVTTTTSSYTTTVPPTTTTITTTIPITTATTIPEPEGCYVGPNSYKDVGWVGERSLTNVATNSVKTETACVQLVEWSEELLGPRDFPSYVLQLVFARDEDGDTVIPYLIQLSHADIGIIGVNTLTHPLYSPSGSGGGYVITLRDVFARDLVEGYLEVGEYYLVELGIVGNLDFGGRQEPYYRIWEEAHDYNVSLVEALKTGSSIPQPAEGAGASVEFIIFGYSDEDPQWPFP